jgi:hypothetical protein
MSCKECEGHRAELNKLRAAIADAENAIDDKSVWGPIDGPRHHWTLADEVANALGGLEAERERLREYVEELRQPREAATQAALTADWNLTQAHDLIQRLGTLAKSIHEMAAADLKAGTCDMLHMIEAEASDMVALADPPKTLEHASTSRRGDCTPGRRAPTPAAVESSGDSHAAVGETDLADPPKGEGDE